MDSKTRRQIAKSLLQAAAKLEAAPVSAASFPFHKGLETEEHLRQGYLAAHSIKAALDAMEEVPNSLMPLYKQTMKTINSAKAAIDDAHQLRMMLLKLSR